MVWLINHFTIVKDKLGCVCAYKGSINEARVLKETWYVENVHRSWRGRRFQSFRVCCVPLCVCIDTGLFLFIFIYIGKTDRYLYTRIKEHSTRENSEIYAHVNSCEHFQHIKSLLELSPHLSNPICTNTTQLIFNNCKVIDKSDHWSLLLFKESLAIRRKNPILNHGAKASKELIIFQ